MEDTCCLLDAARSAAQRSRRVMMTTQIFCLLGGVMLFNSFQANWTHARIDTAQYGRLLFISDECPRAIFFAGGSFMPGDTLGRPVLAIPRMTDEKERAPVVEDWVKHVLAVRTSRGLAPVEPSRLRAAAHFLLARGYGPAELSAYMKKLEEFRFNHVSTFPVPLVGVRLDVNGLGLFTGIGLSILLSWLIMCLSRERRNLSVVHAAFGAPATDALRLDSLFNPGAHRENKGAFPFVVLYWLRWLFPPISLLAPCFLMVLVLINDQGTTTLGKIVQDRMTNWTNGLEIGFLAWITLLSAWSILEYTRLVRAWSAYIREDERVA